MFNVMKDNGKTTGKKTPAKGAKSENLKKVNDKGQGLAERIKFYNELHTKVKMRELHQAALDKINDVEVKQDAKYFADSYESNPRFIFAHGRDTVVSISHPEVVEEVRQYLIGRIEGKMQKLTEEILSH